MWTGGVRVIILDDENRMLMVKQHHEDHDIWMVPGGGIEAGENAAEAAVREVKEETGLEIEAGPLVWHVEEVSDRGQRFVNFFLGKVTGGSVSGVSERRVLESAGVRRVRVSWQMRRKRWRYICVRPVQDKVKTADCRPLQELSNRRNIK